MIVLIPAYEPGWKLINLVVRLDEASHRVVVVNDGSGLEYTAIFDEMRMLGATVLEYREPRGEGYALKHGLEHIADRFPGEDVVSVDGDGRHTAAAITAVACELAANPGVIVLGIGRFDGNVRLPSRLSNLATRALRLVGGLELRDTRTGLRGYPAEVLPWLGNFAGDYVDYEVRVLREAHRRGVPVHAVSIEAASVNSNRIAALSASH